MTLRNVVLVCAFAATIAGLVLVGLGRQPGVPLAIGAGLFTVLMLTERWRYRRSRGEGEADGDYEKTGERYRDPATGEWMEVEFSPKTGTRRYVRAKPATTS